MFAHEKLLVYDKALDFATRAGVWAAAWDKRHALVDHRRFLRLAKSGAVKAAVYVDLSMKAGHWAEADAAVGKGHLRRVNVLLAGF